MIFNWRCVNKLLKTKQMTPPNSVSACVCDILAVMQLMTSKASSKCKRRSKLKRQRHSHLARTPTLIGLIYIKIVAEVDAIEVPASTEVTRNCCFYFPLAMAQVQMQVQVRACACRRRSNVSFHKLASRV